jgi:hypothetical protein
MPNAVKQAKNVSGSCWNCMTGQERLEYLSTLKKANNIANGSLRLKKKGLGATILDVGTATAYNQRSSEGRESAVQWGTLEGMDYSGPNDPKLARDLYCFQHYAEKAIDIAGEAQSAPEDCMPNSVQPQLYNRDGMLGERTQRLIVNYANSGGYKLTPDVELLDVGPIDDIANKLLYNLSWPELDSAVINYQQINDLVDVDGVDGDSNNINQLIADIGGDVSDAPPASDMGSEWVDHYEDIGKNELIGKNPNRGEIRKSPELSAEDKKKAEEARKKFDDLFSGGAKKTTSAFSVDNTFLYLGLGGLVVIGGIVFVKNKKKEKN